jgi:hypothetical protein
MLSPYLDRVPGAKIRPQTLPERGQVWKTRSDPGSPSETDMVGREMLRIVRDAERT